MQSSLDIYINKKKGKAPQKTNEKDHHDSSKQNSQTEPLESKQEKHQKPPIQYNKKALTCIPFFMSCPSDSIHFEKMEEKLKVLKNNYNPTKKNLFYKYIERNLSFHDKRFNAQNLKLIEDEAFWKETLPKMITYFLDNHKNIRGIPTLFSTKKNSKVVVTRGQALTILISLFFGVMPRNPLTKTRSFGQFTTKLSSGQVNAEVRLQKLKFLINYFNMAVEKIQQNDEESNFEYENITFQKHVSNTIEIRNDLNPEKLNGRDPPLMEVVFVEDQQTKIEDYYGEAAMVDFANSQIGGGALRKGCVQEEILFLIFPEAYVSMFLVPEMKDNEAIAIYGLRKYSNYKNYSYNVKFDGAQEKDELKNVKSSVMIAIDATNFRQHPGLDYQFTKQNTLREIAKAITGFNAISESGFNDLSDLKICTGRWGCGAFQGDQIWKFFIQWIACSYIYRNMIYTSDQQEILSQIKPTVQKLVQKGKTVLDLYAIMEEFMKLKRRFSKPPQDHTFIHYIKSQYVL